MVKRLSLTGAITKCKWLQNGRNEAILEAMNEAIKENKGEGKIDFPYFAYTFLVFSFLLACACCLQIPLYAYGNNASWNTPGLFFSLFGFAIVLGIMTLLFAYRIFKAKPNIPLLIIFSVYFLGGFIGALCHGSVFSNSGQLGSISIDDSSFLLRGEAISFSFLTAFALFVFFSIFPNVRRSRASGHIVMRFFALIALFSFLYSLISEWSEYGKALSEGFSNVNITSWQKQKNIYANYLLLGLFCEIVLLEITGRRWHYLPAFLLVIAIFFSFSKAAILIALATCLCYLVYKFIRSKKEGVFAWKNVVLPLILIGISLVLVIVVAIAKPSFFSSIWNAFVSFFKDEGGSNVGSRKAIWDNAVALSSQTPATLIFGQGDLIFPYLMSVAMDVPCIGSAHNAILETLGRGGILRLICLLAFLIYAVRAYVKAFRKSAKDFIMPAIFGLMMICRSIVESPFVFDALVPELAFSYLIMMPVLSEHSLDSVSEPSERKIDSSSIVYIFKNHLGPILALVISLVIAFIPRPISWIVALSIFGLLCILLCVSLCLKKGFIYRNIQGVICLGIGLVALAVFSSLEMNMLTSFASIFGPWLISMCSLVCLRGFKDKEGLSNEPIEYLYACNLANTDDLNNREEAK